jgi:hypothetical protein
MQDTLSTPAARALALPDNQRLAVEALVAGKNRTEAAEAAGVTRKTVHRWLHDPVFLAALHQAPSPAATVGTGERHARGLHALLSPAVLLHRDHPRARVLAARTVLELSARALELEDLCGRAALVEAELEARLNPPGEDPTNNNGAPTTGDPAASIPSAQIGVPQGPSASTPAPRAASAPGPARRTPPSVPLCPSTSASLCVPQKTG